MPRVFLTYRASYPVVRSTFSVYFHSHLNQEYTFTGFTEACNQTILVGDCVIFVYDHQVQVCTVIKTIPSTWYRRRKFKTRIDQVVFFNSRIEAEIKLALGQLEIFHP